MDKFHEHIFYIALYLSYFLYIIAYFKIDQYDKKYLEYLDEFIKYYVMIFLLIRFNPFVKSKFTEFDRTIVFSSAVFILSTTVFSETERSLDFLELFKFYR